MRELIDELRKVLENKMPWQMARGEWEKSGRPDLGINWNKSGKAPWKIGYTEELKAVKEFFDAVWSAQWENKSAINMWAGKIEPDPKTYAKSRVEKLASLLSHKGIRFFHPTSLGISEYIRKAGGYAASLEDAREAILLGRLLGYRDADIVAYLTQNYNLDFGDSNA